MESADDLLGIITGFWQSALLRTMLDLRVADHLEGGLSTPNAIALAEHADPGNVELLLDALCGLGLCVKSGARYSLAPVARGLLTGRGLADVSALWLNDFTWTRFGQLTDIVRRGRPIEPLEADHPFWAETFARASLGLARRSGEFARSLVSLPYGSGARVLDVGCGSGGFGFAFALADPTVVMTAMDSEQVLGVVARNASELSIADRVRLLPTDARAAEAFGEEAFELVILSNVLHLFTPQDAQDLVRKSARALSPGGDLIVADYFADEDRDSAVLPLLFSVFTRLTSPGMAYTYREVETWMHGEGFGSVDRLDRPGSFTFLASRLAGRAGGGNQVSSWPPAGG